MTSNALSDEGLVEQIDCDTAKEFISVLRITEDRWLPNNARKPPWLFRGQSDAKNELVPTAWRNDVIIQKWKSKVLSSLGEPIKTAIITYVAHHPVNTDGSKLVDEFYEHVQENEFLETVLLQAIFEIEVVRNFVEYVDNLGFRIPPPLVTRYDQDGSLRWEGLVASAIENQLKDNEWKAIPFGVWVSKDDPIVALARHHGMPVSLLDWTRKPLIAAFFAAESADINAISRMAVWAVHSSLIGGEGQRLQQPHLERSELGYLHAQDAVLTYDSGADTFFINTGRWPTFYEAVNASNYKLDHLPIRKITAPTSEAPEILRLLWAEEISRAHLMPTFDNITASLQKFWLEP